MNASAKQRLALLATIALAAAATGLACSGDNSSGGNPAPTVMDSGAATDSTTGTDTSTGGDSATPDGGSDPGDSGGTIDVVIIDTGGCVSDASVCNSCYTATQAQQDPYNACSPYTVNCSPFDNKTRTPGFGTSGGVPQVP